MDALDRGRGALEDGVAGNLTRGISAEVEREDGAAWLRWSVEGRLPQCEAVEAITHDVLGRPRTKPVVPGPFITVPRESERVRVWPSRRRK